MISYSQPSCVFTVTDEEASFCGEGQGCPVQAWAEKETAWGEQVDGAPSPAAHGQESWQEDRLVKP